jgi:hypothetical protein
MNNEPSSTPFINPVPTPVIDGQGLQNYLAAMQAEFANQLHHINERLDTVVHDAAPSASATSAYAHHAAAPSHLPSHSTLSRERPATDILGKLLSKPSQFHGEHGNRVYDWLSELDLLFDNLGTITDKEKITFARQCLRDEALRWWIAREQEVVHSGQRLAFAQQNAGVLLPGEAKDSPQTKAITTWVEFKQALVDYFCPRGASEAARNMLHALRQTQFRQLAEYCDCFEQVARRIAVTPGHDITDELIATFKNGLSDGRIRLHLTTSHPSSLFEATRQAMQAESDLRVSNFGMRDHARGGVPNRHPSFNHYRNHGYSTHQPSRQEYPRASGWNHSYSARTAHPFTGQAVRSDTSAPMDLSTVKVIDAEEPVSQWSVSSSDEYAEPQDDELDSAQPSPASESRHDALESESDQEMNFITRERRSSDQQSRWKRGGDRTRFESSRPRRPKQDFLAKNNCWNCGKPGHFLIECPYQKGQANTASASTPAAFSKPQSKKF